jgi:hypothetical protein
MSNRRFRKPSPALVISLIALFVALGGTSYAAVALPKNSVGTMQLKKNAVTSKKIKNHAVTAAKINTKGLTVPSALHATSADSATHATSADSATHATSADSATHATSADSATHATSADSASSATALPALTWSSLTLENGWTAYLPGFGPPGLQYTKDLEGFVHLRGTVNGGSATSNLVGTLPAGFRPASGAWVAIAETNGSFNPFPEAAWIDSSGNIDLYKGTGATNAFVSFEGVEFYAG